METQEGKEIAMKDITKIDDIFTLSKEVEKIFCQLPLEDARQAYIYISALHDRSLAERREV